MINLRKDLVNSILTLGKTIGAGLAGLATIGLTGIGIGVVLGFSLSCNRIEEQRLFKYAMLGFAFTETVGLLLDLLVFNTFPSDFLIFNIASSDLLLSDIIIDGAVFFGGFKSGITSTKKKKTFFNLISSILLTLVVYFSQFLPIVYCGGKEKLATKVGTEVATKAEEAASSSASAPSIGLSTTTTNAPEVQASQIKKDFQVQNPQYKNPTTPVNSDNNKPKAVNTGESYNYLENSCTDLVPYSKNLALVPYGSKEESNTSSSSFQEEVPYSMAFLVETTALLQNKLLEICNSNPNEEICKHVDLPTTNALNTSDSVTISNTLPMSNTGTVSNLSDLSDSVTASNLSDSSNALNISPTNASNHILVKLSKVENLPKFMLKDPEIVNNTLKCKSLYKDLHLIFKKDYDLFLEELSTIKSIDEVEYAKLYPDNSNTQLTPIDLDVKECLKYKYTPSLYTIQEYEIAIKTINVISKLLAKNPEAFSEKVLIELLRKHRMATYRDAVFKGRPEDNHFSTIDHSQKNGAGLVIKAEYLQKKDVPGINVATPTRDEISELIKAGKFNIIVSDIESNPDFKDLLILSGTNSHASISIEFNGNTFTIGFLTSSKGENSFEISSTQLGDQNKSQNVTFLNNLVLEKKFQISEALTTFIKKEEIVSKLVTGFSDNKINYENIKVENMPIIDRWLIIEILRKGCEINLNELKKAYKNLKNEESSYNNKENFNKYCEKKKNDQDNKEKKQKYKNSLDKETKQTYIKYLELEKKFGPINENEFDVENYNKEIEKSHD